MKTRILFTAASVALLAVLPAPAAWAAHETRGYASTRYQVEEVQKLAHLVEDRARRVHRSAERFAHHRDDRRDFREERALVRLHELEERAEHFHRQIERYRQNINRTEGDFGELRRAFTRAAYAMNDLHAFGRVNREFDRLSDAMYDLEMYAEDLFDRARPANRRYRQHRRYPRSSHRARIVLPRVRVSWDWLEH